MINIVGYFAGQFGIGIAARNIARAVATAAGQTPCCSMLPSGLGRDVVTPPFAVPPVGSIALRHRATLLISAAIPSDGDLQVAHLVKQRGSPLAILAYWEMTELPEAALAYLQLADVLFGGSPFTREVFQRYFPRKPCFELPCPVWLDSTVHHADRAGFGLPEDVPIVLTSFEPLSDPLRKNTEAAIRAFADSASEHNGHLVLKVNWPLGAPKDAAGPLFSAARKLIDDARAMPRVVVLDESLPYERLLQLYASADVLLSLHRAEGLGLVILEGMSLGKAVIATGYSGNLAFMRLDHPGLVPYRQVPAGGLYDFYNATALAYRTRAPMWAEPDTATATVLLARALRDHDFAARLGSIGRSMAETYERRARAAPWLQELQPKFPQPYGNISYSFG